MPNVLRQSREFWKYNGYMDGQMDMWIDRSDYLIDKSIDKGKIKNRQKNCLDYKIILQPKVNHKETMFSFVF